RPRGCCGLSSQSERCGGAFTGGRGSRQNPIGNLGGSRTNSQHSPHYCGVRRGSPRDVHRKHSYRKPQDRAHYSAKRGSHAAQDGRSAAYWNLSMKPSNRPPVELHRLISSALKDKTLVERIRSDPRPVYESFGVPHDEQTLLLEDPRNAMSRTLGSGNGAEQATQSIAEGMAEISRHIVQSRPDVLVLVSSDHLNNFTLDAQMPIAIGIADEYRPLGDMGIPVQTFQGSRDF